MSEPQELIRRKRDGLELTKEQLSEFFGSYLDQQVTDYQMAAMLMAIYWRGLSDEETSVLTLLSRDSGHVFSWDTPKEMIVDKHSTGGVGDKTSLIVLPLAVAAGLKVPMMAGRGLGHTGGTLDKLESIAGMQVFLSPEKVRQQVGRLGGVFFGQTPSITALDGKLYALRDVTATVESIPLICASILSKKLAEGLGSLVLDVKFGSGAFMKEVPQARALATALVKVGRACGLNVAALLTDMNSPLGHSAGNALEVAECLEVLQGQGPLDTKELSLALATEMVLAADPSRRVEQVRAELESYLTNGKAMEIFLRVVSAQGGETSSLERADCKHGLAQSKYIVPLKAPESGVIVSWDVRSLGLAILQLGGGRIRLTDKVDPAVGISALKRRGARVAAGEPVALIHGNCEDRVKKASQTVYKAITLEENLVSTNEEQLVLERIYGDK